MQITQEIISVSVVTTPPAPQGVHEALARPEVLTGSTYKVKTPLYDHALYITINDLVLNPGTDNQTRHPFEIFINSKNMDSYQWVVALTRIMSAVFRKGGNVTFLVEEMRAVFDPKGGYFKKGGTYMPSLVAEIGAVIETHLKGLGLIVEDTALADAAKAMVAEKKATATDQRLWCAKCHEKAVVVMDGCETCLNCGNSKCN